MKSKKLEFPGSAGETLSARIDFPDEGKATLQAAHRVKSCKAVVLLAGRTFKIKTVAP